MSTTIIITPEDPILQRLHFKPYRNFVERKAVPFVPKETEPQTMDINTPWGAQLTAKRGDILVSEMDKPDDYWPVDPEIFEQSYLMVRPGICIKSAITLLVPLAEVTNGDEDQLVTVISLEGPQTVRAGDFYLAKGVQGEIWPYPKEKVSEVMRPVE